jgi:hypothetical protein
LWDPVVLNLLLLPSFLVCLLLATLLLWLSRGRVAAPLVGARS